MVTHISVVIHVLKLGVRVPMLQLKNLKILMVHQCCQKWRQSAKVALLDLLVAPKI